MVRELVPSMSDMSSKPLWYDYRIGSYMIIYQGHFYSWNGASWWGTRKTQFMTEGHSNMTVRFVLRWSDMSAWPFWCDRGMCSHLIRCKGWSHSVMAKGLGSSHVRYECWPFWLSVRYKGYCHSLNGATWWGTRDPQSRTDSLYDVTKGCVPMYSDVSAVAFS